MTKKITAVLSAAMIILTACADTSSSQAQSSDSNQTSSTDSTASEAAVPAERRLVDASEITYASSFTFDKMLPEGVEKAEFSVDIEAETAEEKKGALIRPDDDASGESYTDISDNTAFSLTVDIPASQYYSISVVHKASGHKENPLLFNGEKVMDIVSESGDWQTSTADGIFLNKGTNTITLGSGWSYFSIDKISVKNGESISDSIYSSVTPTLSNKYANLKTQNIYQYLLAVYGKRTLTGQCTNHGKNTETDAIFKQFGKYPAVRTFDFIFDSPNYNKGNSDGKDTDLAIQWSKDGGLVVFDWHWFAPSGKVEFYTEKGDFKLSSAVTDQDIATLPLDEIKTLADTGKISEECYALVSDIDHIASLLQKLEDNNVTVLWRPLHEASGGWFWWGASGAEDYKWLWKLMYQRMTDLFELDNLIWVWNAQSGDWYPGDEYCDICALDIYNEAHDYGVSAAAFTELSGWAGNSKLVTMSECATMPDPELIVRDNAYWLWFAVWNGDYLVKAKTTHLSDAYTSLEMMQKVYTSEEMITRDQLPDFDAIS